MADQSSQPASDGNGNGESVPFFQQITTMTRAFFASSMRNHLLLLGLGILVVIVANAYSQTLLNAWNQPFYDALSKRDLDGFLWQFLVFLGVAGSLLVLNVAQAWLNQITKMRLRQGLVLDLFDQWLEPGRAFRLVHASEIGANPDQRMHEDARRLTELTTDLGIGLLQSSILLGTFITVLWALSENFTFTLFGTTFGIPGYMVWAAFLYTGLASWLSWLVGHRLILLNSEKYAREAELRFSMVRVSEHIDAITLQGGEGDEKKRLINDLNSVLTATRRLITVAVRLTWVTSGYGWLSMVAPIIIAAPAYFSGGITFGGLMVAVGAFNQVQASLRWFIDNFSNIADWRATLLRVASFRRAVEETDTLHGSNPEIEVVEGPPGRLALHNLCLASPTGSTRLREEDVEISSGERVLIVGEQGAGKTLLFRAIAGLWPWGAGRVELPAGEPMMFMPRTPYVPPGLLKSVLAYPDPPDTFSDEACAYALDRLGLARLSDKLAVDARWDKDLQEDERLAISFARVLLHRPSWIIIDAALEGLEDDLRARIFNVFVEDLGAAAIIHVGRYEQQDHLFDRLLHLEKVQEGGLARKRPPRARAPHRFIAAR